VTAQPGADEHRIRAILRSRGVGPSAIPPKPTVRPRDWLDDILNSPAPAPAAATPKPKPAQPPSTASNTPTKTKKQKRRKTRKPSPDTARSAWDTRPPSPRQSLLDAWDGVPYRLKWLAYHASAAYLGWTIGLVSWVTYVTAWIAGHGLTDPQAIFWYAAALAAFLLYRRTRSWWWPVAWLAAVPAASVVVGVLLYAPTQ
jgi:hypothetical protein